MSSKCRVCEREGPKTRSSDFLCEDCVYKGGVSIVCNGCHTRQQIPDNSPLLSKLKVSFPDLNVGESVRGLVIRWEICENCATPDHPLSGGEIFRARL